MRKNWLGLTVCILWLAELPCVLRKIPLIQVILNNQRSYTELICHLVVIQTCPYLPSGLNHSLGAPATCAVLCSGGAAQSLRAQGSSTPAPLLQASASVKAVHVTHSPTQRLKKTKTQHTFSLRQSRTMHLFRGAASSCGVRIPFCVEVKSSLMASVQAETQGASCMPCLRYRKLRGWLGRR